MRTKTIKYRGFWIGMSLCMLIACGSSDTASTTTPINPTPDTQQPTPDTQQPTPDATTPTSMSVTKVTPSVGRTAGGELVVLQGTLFQSGMEVFFGSARAPEVTVHSASIAHVRTPMHKSGKVDLQLRLVDNTELRIEQAFLFRDELAIHAIEPSEGPIKGGTPVTIHGDGFAHDTNLLFDGRLAVDIEVMDSQTIHAISPPGEHGAADVLVGTPWTSAVVDKGFHYYQPLQVESIKPSNGPTDDVTIITISGTGFSPDSAVSIGNVKATVLPESTDETLIVQVPGGPAGVVDVTIQTPRDGLVVSDGFVFLSPETTTQEAVLHHVVPNEGVESGGTTVTLVVTGFSNTNPTVRFGNITAPIQSIDMENNQLVVTAPPGVGLVDVHVETDSEDAELASAFTYLSVPKITSISPTAGTMDGGETVSIYGSNLNGSPEVLIGSLPAQVLQADDGLIRVRTPPRKPGNCRRARGDRGWRGDTQQRVSLPAQQWPRIVRNRARLWCHCWQHLGSRLRSRFHDRWRRNVWRCVQPSSTKTLQHHIGCAFTQSGDQRSCGCLHYTRRTHPFSRQRVQLLQSGFTLWRCLGPGHRWDCQRHRIGHL